MLFLALLLTKFFFRIWKMTNILSAILSLNFVFNLAKKSIKRMKQKRMKSDWELISSYSCIAFFLCFSVIVLWFSINNIKNQWFCFFKFKIIQYDEIRCHIIYSTQINIEINKEKTREIRENILIENLWFVKKLKWKKKTRSQYGDLYNLLEEYLWSLK